MRRRTLDDADRDTVVLALAVALCGLVLVAAVAASVLGDTVAVGIAFLWLALLVCLALCVRRLRRAAPARGRRRHSAP